MTLLGGARLRFYDPVTPAWLLTYEEADQRAEMEAHRAKVERGRAADEIEGLKAELEALRGRLR